MPTSTTQSPTAAHPDDLPAGAPELEGFRHPGFRWVDRIACKDNELRTMFANAGHVLDDATKAQCMTCPVWQECLIYSYLGAPDGKMITGGYFAALSPGQRKKLTLTQAIALGKRQREKFASRSRNRGSR